MKTQSIKSIATLLGVAVALNVGALAGPDMHLLSAGAHRASEAQERKVSDHKNAVTAATRQEDSKTVKPATQSRAVTYYSSPHGGIAVR
jgi:hypothetical protein